MAVDDVYFDLQYDAYYNINCPHCHAEWGHFIVCPLINRNIAEAVSAVNGASEKDNIIAHALGISLT